MSGNVGGATSPLDYKTLKSGKQLMKVSFGNDKSPGIKGEIRFEVSLWNEVK